MVTSTALADAEPSPAIREELRWLSGAASTPTATLEITTEDVSRARIVLRQARYVAGSRGTVEAQLNSAAVVTLAEFRPGTSVNVDDASPSRVSTSGALFVNLAPGKHTITFK